MDREDWLYLSGAVVCAAGCGWMYPPAGLVCLGVFAVFPPIVNLFRTKGPQE